MDKHQKEIPQKSWTRYEWISIYVLSTVIFILSSYILFLVFFHNSFFPGIKVANINLTHKTLGQAYYLLQTKSEAEINQPLKLTYQNQEYIINLQESEPKLDVDKTLREAYQIGRSGNHLLDLKAQLKALIIGVNFSPSLEFKKKPFLNSEITAVGQMIKKPAVNATLKLGENLIITPSEEGLELDSNLLQTQIENYLKFKAPAPKFLSVKKLPPSFSSQTAERYKLVLEKVKTNPLKLQFLDQAWIIDQASLYNLLDFQPAEEHLNQDNPFNESKLGNYLEDIAGKIYQPVQEGRFTFEASSKRVSKFQEAKEGRELDRKQTIKLLTENLIKDKPEVIILPVKITQPKSNTGDSNSFGIRELLGEGVSYFSGSITNRIFNIGLAASRLNGVLVAPNTTFSFNDIVGDVSAATGYKQAYVIKEGRTVLDDGGGVCQVSTTLFRAVLNTGLPVIARTAHAYRVSYYEQGGFMPGLDATVYAPSVDFKFKNDTANYVLIQANVQGTSLIIDIYGTADGRVSTITKPVILSQTPPLPELRQDDPTLPKGTIKQVDWPAWGAKVVFDRTVIRSEETLIKETWTSNFRSWQAVYLVGTKEN